MKHFFKSKLYEGGGIFYTMHVSIMQYYFTIIISSPFLIQLLFNALYHNLKIGYKWW